MEETENSPVEYTAPPQPISDYEIQAIRSDQNEAKKETQYRGDDLSDLFEAPKMDDPDMDVSDVVNVDLDEDVMDGDIEEVVEVTEDDIMGEDIHGEENDDLSDLFELTPGRPASMPEEGEEKELGLPRRYRLSPKGRRVIRPLPSPSMGSMESEEG